MKKLLLIISTLFVVQSITAYSQKLQRGVWGAGGTTAISGSTMLHGTVSQTAIGRSIGANGEVHSGFWYTLYGMLPAYDAGLLVIIPVFSGSAGNTVEMPIYLDSATNLPIGKEWNFTGSYTFNASVLEPISGFDYRGIDKINRIDTIYFSGTAADTTKILKTITYRVKLGNQAVSPVNWIDFRIKELPKAAIFKKDGEFQLEDLCFAGGKPRLIESLKDGLALKAYPLPAHNSLTIAAQVIEKGITELTLISNEGKVLKTLYSGKLTPGFHEMPIDIEQIPSGSYFLVMKTPSDLLTTRCVIQK